LALAVGAAGLALSGCGGNDSPPPAEEPAVTPDPTPIVDPDAIAVLQPVPDVDPQYAPRQDCSLTGIGATQLAADKLLDGSVAAATITGVTAVAAAGANPAYCRVNVKVDPAINFVVVMPTDYWNGRFQSEGGGGYAGSAGVSTAALTRHWVGVQTDTGHTSAVGGAFGMKTVNGVNVADTQLQTDFAYRSEHLMSVIGKQLSKAFYGQDPIRSYWNGCSTGGRQGLRMAQDFPDDYDAIFAGSSAIHWDRFQAYQIWPQVAMYRDNAQTVVPGAKLTLATNRAIAVCDALDGIKDGVIDDPRVCNYDPTMDTNAADGGITGTATSCAANDNTCLRPTEASAILKIWNGARDANGNLLWPGLERGTPLASLAGTAPFSIATQQPQYWVYFDPTWDWKTLTYANYGQFMQDTIKMVGPMMASDNPDLSAFRKRGGKIIMHHGWADPLIMPQGSVRYYEAVKATMGADKANDFIRLFMVPGMGHCGGSTGKSPGTIDWLGALTAWSEAKAGTGDAKGPDTLPATHATGGAVDRSRPLCNYPKVARWNGSGSTDDAANFSCVMPG
jgi:hypothetical protein